MHIMIAGLAFQVLSLLMFLGLSGEFAITVLKTAENEKPARFARVRATKRFKSFQIGGLPTIQSELTIQGSV